MIPTYNGRKMKKIKEYESVVLYQDPQTKVRECFTKSELTMMTDEERQKFFEQNMNHIPRID